MFFAASSKPQRLLYFGFIEHVSVEDMQHARSDVEAMLTELPAGFRLLADLGRLDSMETDCAVELGKVMDMLDKRGVSLVVRVIPDATKDIGLNILSVIHYGHRPKTATCSTMKEAAERLSL